MSTKQLVIHALTKLPDDADFADISEQVAFLAAIEEGERAGREGRVVTNDEMKRRLEKWLTE